MNRTKIWSIGSLLTGIVLGWATADFAMAQSWQPVTRADVSSREEAAPVDWEQRVQKRPPALQWQSGQPTAQRTSYNESYDPPTTARTSRVARRPSARLVSNEEPEVIAPGTIQLEPMSDNGAYAGEGRRSRSGCGCGRHGGELTEDGGCDSCDSGDSCGGCGDCDDGCDYGYEIFDGRGCFRWFRDLSVFAGAQGFKNGIDNGKNGNFGLHEGLNLAGPLGDPWGCGYQLGANVVQSDFSGATTLNVRTNDNVYTLYAADRKQYFLTAAIFQRPQCGGFQWGIAFDYLHDSYYEESDLKQLRNETGFVFGNDWEIGYFGAYGIGSDRAVYGKLDVTDMFCLYVRRTFENGGEGRIWGGATGNADGLLGADLWVPLGKSFALGNRLNYMIPKQGRGDTAQSREAWGISIDLIWYLGQNAKCMQQNPYRSLFNVAHNSRFMVDRLSTRK